MLKITSESPNIGVVNGGLVSGNLSSGYKDAYHCHCKPVLRLNQLNVPLNGIG